MSEHQATVRWQRTSSDFTYDSYNRAHTWSFDAGIEVQASAAPVYRGDDERVDPEEAFVAAVSSCHMLTFLAIAARKRYTVDAYEDRAVGTMTKNDAGRLWVSRITLRPRIVFGSERVPTPEQMAQLHALAHANCFIAQSVRTEVVVESGSAPDSALDALQRT